MESVRKRGCNIAQATVQAAMSNGTIFVIRNDENEEYDRAQATAYLARLKKIIAADSGSPLTLMAKEVVKSDRTHMEIREVPKSKVEEHKSKGFTEVLDN